MYSGVWPQLVTLPIFAISAGCPLMPLYCVQIDDGLRMQSEDLDTAAARVMELAAELDIKQEMRNRATVRSKEIST